MCRHSWIWLANRVDLCWFWLQAMVNVLGVVQSVGAVGSVKRKSDMSELLRRDLTLVDQRCGQIVSHAMNPRTQVVCAPKPLYREDTFTTSGIMT